MQHSALFYVLAESEVLAIVGGPFDHFEVIGAFAAIVLVS